MGDTIKFTYDNRDYLLKYTKRSIKRMEAEGFNYQEIDTKPMTMIPLLVKGAFIPHQPWITDDEIDNIISEIKDKSGFYAKLSEMYSEQLKYLAEDEGKNLEWTVV